MELAWRAGHLRPGLKLLFSSGFPEASLDAKEPIPDGVSLLSKPYRKAELAQKVRSALVA